MSWGKDLLLALVAVSKFRLGRGSERIAGAGRGIELPGAKLISFIKISCTENLRFLKAGLFPNGSPPFVSLLYITLGFG
jgi:hypothetical protein